jgi:RNA polymerase sigma-70 factor (ECF subfamily)
MDHGPETRASLLVRLRDPQDERAWSEFAAIYSPLIYRLGRRKGLQDADAQDLVQDVLRAVAGAIDRWDPDPNRGSFRGWLFKIARNLLINTLTRQGHHPRGAGGTDFLHLLEEQPDPNADDTALFETEYRRQLFLWAVEQVRGEFQETTWQAFWRTGVENQKPRDVAEALGSTVGAVYVYRNRVMARLRRKIAEVEGEPSL